MTSLLGQPVFRIADETYRWEDVLIAAAMWGQWDAAERDTREGLACLSEANRAGPPRGFDEEVRQAAADFRYARGLVAADEALAWLRQWSLTTEQWTRFIRCSVLRRLWGARLSELVRDTASPGAAIADEIVTTLICGEYLSRAARKLASRAALRDRLATGGATGGATGFASRHANTPRSTPDDAGLPQSLCVGLLSHLASAQVRASITRVKDGDSAVSELQDMLRGSAVLEREVDAHQIDWVQVEFRTLGFNSAEAAREAALCLREDGLDLADVASAASAVVQTAGCYLDAMSGELHDQFLAARAGDVIGPIDDNGTFMLYRIDAKRLPSTSDPEIRQRAEHAALQRTLARELNDRVLWLVRV